MFCTRELSTYTNTSSAMVNTRYSELEEKIGELGSVKSVEDIARSELGLADPNTLILDLQPQS